MKNCQEIMGKGPNNSTYFGIGVFKVNAGLDSDIKSFDGLFLNHAFLCFLKIGFSGALH
jgi:hypothetical protein